MKSHITGMVATVLLSIFAPVFAADVELNIDTTQELNRIDEKIYGHFLEHIYHSVNGGLWGDLVWNRSFEDNSSGGWSQTNDVIVQKSLDVDQRFVFGEIDWQNYEYTLEARKTGGTEGFLILFHVQNDEQFSWVNLGGWQNRQHGIERRNASQNRQSVIGRQISGGIETGKWYTIKVRCEDNNTKIWLDDQLLFDQNDDGAAKTGSVGVGTWGTQAEFRNIKVTSLDGKTVLLAEMPELKQQLKLRHWEVFGDAEVSLNDTDTYNSKYALQITSRGDSYCGIKQSGFHLNRGETYIVSCWMKQLDGDHPLPFCFNFRYGYTAAEYSGQMTSNEWKFFQTEFSPVSTSDPDIIDDATFCLNITRNGHTVLIDQISIMPKSWAENGGFRPDLLGAIDALKAPIIRWPGGCFASAYRWKDGIGPQEKRGAYPFTIWDDREVNSYGTDEFLDMCRRVKTEPLIVINTGTRGWNANRTPESANVDWVQEACDWLEYCNGPITSKWGKVRAENGHPEPYNVKYWEIDNEIETSVEEYIASIKKFVPAMKKIDPTIKIIVCGSWRGARLQWDGRLVNEVGELFDYLSFHQYDDPNTFADGPGRIEKYFRELGKVIADSPNKHVKIFDSEWNAQSTDWRTGLYCGGMLNVFERCGDIVEIAAPALFLRHNSAKDWDNAFVNFDNKSWYPAPNYVVMKLWREHYAPIRIALNGETGPLNTVATQSEDGKTVYFKVVNPTNEPHNVMLKLDRPVESAKMQFVVASSLRDRNTLENPSTIAPQSGDVKHDGQTVTLTLPAYSATVVTVQ